ncbi:hypothetical protein WR25_25301 [Diploscapter pachys]|uniref:Uncharacterized protein n=1 Tax=Diploscapter pachys TaxID=2018661 RepID=A0A2A2M4F1_9BILA|nr:hypothetical protein WR25_25301 [Diploscapter pachys]
MRVALIGQDDQRATATGELVAVTVKASAHRLFVRLALIGEVQRTRRLDGRYRVLVDELRHAFPLEQHAEQVEPGDLALQHHAVDQEHRDRIFGFAHRVQENFLQQRLLALRFSHGFDNPGQVHRAGRHDRGDGVLVDQLRLAVAAEQHGEIVEPGNDTLEFDALHQEHGDRGLGAAQRIQEEVLQRALLFGHELSLFPLLAGRSPAIAPFPGVGIAAHDRQRPRIYERRPVP